MATFPGEGTVGAWWWGDVKMSHRLAKMEIQCAQIRGNRQTKEECGDGKASTQGARSAWWDRLRSAALCLPSRKSQVRGGYAGYGLVMGLSRRQNHEKHRKSNHQKGYRRGPSLFVGGWDHAVQRWSLIPSTSSGTELRHEATLEEGPRDGDRRSYLTNRVQYRAPPSGCLSACS